MIAESLGLIRRLCLEVKSEPRQQKRQSIGKIVAGVGEKRQAVRSNSGDELDNDEHRGGNQRPPQDTARPPAVGMRVHNYILRWNRVKVGQTFLPSSRLFAIS